MSDQRPATGDQRPAIPDVLIVGAGPAGSLAALVLARAGARVRLLERSRIPRDKLCGDTVNPGAVAILNRLGLAHVFEGSLPLDGMIVTGASGVRVQARYGNGLQGRAILRRDLDRRLIEAAAAAGAQVEDGVVATGASLDTSRDVDRVTGITVKTADGRSQQIAARVVIAADGSHSRVARELRLSRFTDRPRRWAVGAYFENVRGLTTCGEMHVRDDRYIGVAPLPGGLANVCVVTADRALLRHPHALLDETIHSDRELAGRFTAAAPMGEARCLGPMAVECGQPGMEGLLLAGDAAGFIDPMTGDGLRFALRGAELAAAAALRALEHGWDAAHLRLAQARRREFQAKWRFNRTLRSMVSSPAAVRVANRGAAVAPVVVRSLIKYAADLRVA